MKKLSEKLKHTLQMQTDAITVVNQYIKSKTMGKNQHVVPHDGQWAVLGEGNQRVTKITRTQQEAIDIAREISRNQESELLIHRPYGRIRARDSHGNDPYPPKG